MIESTYSYTHFIATFIKPIKWSQNYNTNNSIIFNCQHIKCNEVSFTIYSLPTHQSFSQCNQHMCQHAHSDNLLIIYSLSASMHWFKNAIRKTHIIFHDNLEDSNKTLTHHPTTSQLLLWSSGCLLFRQNITTKIYFFSAL